MAYSDAAYEAQQQKAGLKSGNYNVGVAGPVAGAAKAITPTAKQIPAARPNFVGQVAKQTFNIGTALAKGVGSFVVHTAQDVGRQAQGASLAMHPEIAMARQQGINKAQQILDAKQKQITAAYKSGKMSKENYGKSMQDLSKGYAQISKETTKLIKDTDPQKLASDTVWTAINVLTAGTTGLARAGAVKTGSVALDAVLNKSAQQLEKTITKVPAARELIERNTAKVVTREAQKMAGESTEQWLARSGKQAAIGLLIKRPVFYQTNVGLATDTYDHIMKGDYDEAAKSAGWMGAQMVGGGPIGWFLKEGKRGLGHVSSLARGKGSFIDELSGRIGNGNRGQIAALVEKDQEAAKTFRILQQTNLQAANGNVETAAENVTQHYIQNGIDLATVTPEQLAKDMGNWAKADELAAKTIRQGVIKGVNKEDVTKYAVVRWDTATRNGVAKAVEASDGTPQGILDAVQALADNPAAGWANNEVLMNKIMSIIGKGLTKEQTAKEIQSISTASTLLSGVPKKVAKELADLGFTVAAPFGGNKIARINYDEVDKLPKLVTAAVKGDTELFDQARNPEPILSSISNALTKVGLSPEAANTVAHERLSESLIGNLGELGIARNLGLKGEGDMINGGRVILRELQNYIETKPGARVVSKISSGSSAVTDIRQLTNKEISQALSITMGEAKDVSRAIRKAYTDVPLEFRGLGDALVDWTIRAPLSPMRYYLRTQSALRYTYNPFFRFQEQVETNILSSMNANRFIWAMPGTKLDDAVKTLDTHGFFSGNTFGAGADDNVIGKISANLTKFQKRNLAGLAETIAKGQGKTLEQVLADNPDQIDDALRIIVQYPRKGGISSPLARTINIAFFPMRYNLKVTEMVAEKLAKQPPSVQLAMIQGIFKAREWMKSDEGLRWQAENAEAIKVFSWATPLGNIQSMAKLLTGSVDGIGDLGLLGGLPFGFISQILDAEGIINLNKPYVNPTTGEVLPDYIPQNTKAQAAVALQTFLGTMFSFPGRTLGLPGKEASIRDAVNKFIDTNGADFEKRVRTEDLTPLQKNMIRVIKGDTSQEAIDALYYSPAPGQFDYYTIPPFNLPLTKPINDPKPTPIDRSLKLPKAKKAGSADGKKVKPLPQPIPSR